MIRQLIDAFTPQIYLAIECQQTDPGFTGSVEVKVLVVFNNVAFSKTAPAGFWTSRAMVNNPLLRQPNVLRFLGRINELEPRSGWNLGSLSTITNRLPIMDHEGVIYGGYGGPNTLQRRFNDPPVVVVGESDTLPLTKSWLTSYGVPHSTEVLILGDCPNGWNVYGYPRRLLVFCDDHRMMTALNMQAGQDPTTFAPTGLTAHTSIY